MNYSELYKIGEQHLSDAGIAEAALDARLLLEFVTGNDRNTLYAHPETLVAEADAASYEKLLAKRAAHVPLCQITGSCEFMGIEFAVNENVLIPRQDSECLVEEAMRYVNDGDYILDLCTGSGCLLLSLMHYKNGCRGVGIDISQDALDVARKNADTLASSGALNGGEVSLYAGDLYEPITDNDTRFDVIISNPPYIRHDVIATLMPEVRDHEPRIALDGGDDGLTFYRRIAESAPAHLAKGGRIFLEIGYDQGEAVASILADAGFADINIVKDYSGNDRVVVAICHRYAPNKSESAF